MQRWGGKFFPVKIPARIPVPDFLEGRFQAA
jgi:hypothetical protein